LPRSRSRRDARGGHLNIADEPIAPSSECLNENGRFRRFAQRVAQPLYSGIQAVIEVDERVRRPELAPQFLSGNDFSRLFKQRGQHLKWLFLEFYLLSALAQLSGAEIYLERTESNNSGWGIS
jgi:hypothetical protein